MRKASSIRELQNKERNVIPAQAGIQYSYVIARSALYNAAIFFCHSLFFVRPVDMMPVYALLYTSGKK